MYSLSIIIISNIDLYCSTQSYTTLYYHLLFLLIGANLLLCELKTFNKILFIHKCVTIF